MDDFECVCSVTKGERSVAWGEDCYCYYPKANYEERIVRCRDCAYRLEGHAICKLRDPLMFTVSLDGFCDRGVLHGNA